MSYRLCKECGCPILKKGQTRKFPEDYRHASGCPNDDIPSSYKFGVLIECELCGLQKKPRGRSAPLEMRMCDEECAGYEQKPFAGSLWPGESEADFGYLVGLTGVEIRIAAKEHP